MIAAAVAQSEPTPYASDPNALPWPPKERFPLWPGKPPGAPARPIVPDWTMNGPPDNREIWVRGVAMPEVHVFRPARPDGSALLSIPGGGYGFLSIQNEGIDVAERFNAEGTTVFVLTYRLPGEGWTDRALAPLQDAQRAMRLIRSRAADFRIDPARLGILGFSAGGHLASTTGTHFDAGVASSSDPIERASSRPDFEILLYPVITMRDSVAHAGSKLNLLGKDPSPELVHLLSNEEQVTAQTPPTFLVHTVDDRTVPVENTLLFYRALRAAGVPAEMHIFEHGPHGFGLATNNPVLATWTSLCENWMRMHGWLGASK